MRQNLTSPHGYPELAVGLFKTLKLYQSRFLIINAERKSSSKPIRIASKHPVNALLLNEKNLFGGKAFSMR